MNDEVEHEAGAEGVIGSEDRYERGLETRRAVLGRRARRPLARAGLAPSSRPMQELVTEYCWGAVWNREGLDRRTRSLLNLAMLTALNRPQELGAHVRGALTNGCIEGGDPGDAAAGRRLLRHAGRARRLPRRRAGARRGPRSGDRDDRFRRARPHGRADDRPAGRGGARGARLRCGSRRPRPRRSGCRRIAPGGGGRGGCGRADARHLGDRPAGRARRGPARRRRFRSPGRRHGLVGSEPDARAGRRGRSARRPLPRRPGLGRGRRGGGGDADDHGRRLRGGSGRRAARSSRRSERRSCTPAPSVPGTP